MNGDSLVLGKLRGAWKRVKWLACPPVPKIFSPMFVHMQLQSKGQWWLWTTPLGAYMHACCLSSVFSNRPRLQESYHHSQKPTLRPSTIKAVTVELWIIWSQILQELLSGDIHIYWTPGARNTRRHSRFSSSLNWVFCLINSEDIPHIANMSTSYPSRHRS